MNIKGFVVAWIIMAVIVTLISLATYQFALGAESDCVAIILPENLSSLTDMDCYKIHTLLVKASVDGEKCVYIMNSWWKGEQSVPWFEEDMDDI